MAGQMIVSIAVGGAVGALARYAMMGAVGKWLGTGFPYATITVNVLGCFAMGALIEVFALEGSLGPEIKALLTVGFLGAFTTFSAFSLDLYVLIEHDRLAAAALYAVLSVLLSVLAFFGGLYLFRHILP
ncbi:MAG: fluoride efflux transporter CrcB [Alphaproteobacteria bacterium]|nr:fluoride efflux transporter CrcB [Alphaproteobacteria bacterium]